jgi:formyl-CoA transferase
VPGVGRDVSVTTTGIKLDGEAPRVDNPPPLLGEHNGEIWTGLGISEAELSELQNDGAL